MHRSNAFSRLFGKFAHMEFPKWFQHIINKTYIKIFDINLDEHKDYTEYKSLNELFTRTFVKPRKIDSKPCNLISPTDSLIMESGFISDNKALQIKGKSYAVPELLFGYGTMYKKDYDKNALDNYSFLNLYLSPRDYHHYHAPSDLEVLEARYFSGKLLPVNKKSLLKNENLFVSNERVVLKVRLKYNGKIAYIVAVGALNVGKMRFYFDSSLQSNARLGDRICVYENPISLKAGEDMGCFEMGSTIVLIAEANFIVKTNDVVKMGEEIATLSKREIN